MASYLDVNDAHRLEVAVFLLIAVLAQGAAQAPSTTPPNAIPIPPVSAEALAADSGVLRHAGRRTPPVARATRVAGAPTVDGRLDDAAWVDIAPITALYQREPLEGQEASERTEVRIVYDNDAIYVAARMFDREPRLIRAELGRRDNTGASDEFTIAFDSYLDHRTAFQFSVNPSGVRADQSLGADDAFGDESWDPVWEAQARRDSLGWTAEMRIPFSQLRFSPAPQQTWGVNVRRHIQRKAETVEFGWKLNTEEGYASHFGHLFGLADLPQPRRLELLPYATATQRLDQPQVGNPFRDGSRATADFGADLKYGITSNITLDATVNPDFGQVEQDPAFVNLSAFEQFLQERRPFFVEGADIFRFNSNNQVFYSRRIGQPPRGSAGAGGDYVDQPENSTILAAGKVTGRTSSGWSIGILEAVTQREFATVQDDTTGLRSSHEVEPLTNYLVARLKRDMRGGATQFGTMFTAVNRDLDNANLQFLRRAAYAGGVDFTHRFRRNQYSASGSFIASYIRGETQSILNAQRSSARYYQRPDADYVEVDPARRSLSGWSSRLNLARTQGNLTWSLRADATSPGFEINDAGFQTRGDNRSVGTNVQHRWTRPGSLVRSAYWGGDLIRTWNSGGVQTGTFLGSYYGVTLLNYWSINGSIGTNPVDAYNDVLTRGGPLGYSAAGGSVFLGIDSDYRKPVRVSFGGSYFTNNIAAWSLYTFVNLTVRPTSNINVDIGPSLSTSETVQQYLLTQTDPTATATYGNRYVFGEIMQKVLDFTTRLNITFSPALSLQLYTQPFIATGEFTNFKELARPGAADFIVYGGTPGSTLRDSTTAGGSVIHIGDPDGAGPRPEVLIGDPNFSSRSLRGNAVLRWEYRPGSTLFFVWTQSCGRDSSNPRFAPGEDFRHLCQGRSLNAFAIKANWWLSL